MTPAFDAPSNWRFDRLANERTQAIAAFALTERQARFLVEVMIHSGVFVERQYCRFAGIVHGQKTHDFLRKLVERGYARPIQVGSAPRSPVSRRAQADVRRDWAGRQSAPKVDADRTDGGAADGAGRGACRPLVHMARDRAGQTDAFSYSPSRAGDGGRLSADYVRVWRGVNPPMFPRQAADRHPAEQRRSRFHLPHNEANAGRLPRLLAAACGTAWVA